MMFSDTCDLLLDTLCSARANAYGCDHRGNADHNTQHGKRGAELIHLQRPKRDAHGRDQVLHGDTTAAVCAATASTGTVIGLVTFWSLTTRPSRKRMIRPAYAAISSECVTMTIVIP